MSDDLTPEQKDALIAQFRATDAALKEQKEEVYGYAPNDDASIPTVAAPVPGGMTLDMAAILQMMANMQAEIRTLKSAPTVANPVDSVSQGGPPVPHHLHLVNGDVITDHDGIATHYSYPDGTVVRVRAHFPANEADPATLNR